MFKKITSLIQGKPKKNKVPEKLEVEGVEAYFHRELESCELISEDKYSVVMQDLLHKKKT